MIDIFVIEMLYSCTVVQYERKGRKAKGKAKKEDRNQNRRWPRWNVTQNPPHETAKTGNICTSLSWTCPNCSMHVYFPVVECVLSLTSHPYRPWGSTSPVVTRLSSRGHAGSLRIKLMSFLTQDKGRCIMGTRLCNQRKHVPASGDPHPRAVISALRGAKKRKEGT